MPKIVCPTCEGKGFIAEEKAGKSPFDGKIEPVHTTKTCPQCKGKKEVKF